MLKVSNLKKRFGGLVALQGVDIMCRAVRSWASSA